MTVFSARPGFALPAVLFISLLGILLGFGRLITFHNQCRLRIDRQQEYEKVFAVRSVLNRLQNAGSSFPVEGGPDDLIAVRTTSGREVKVLLHPADAIFPVMDNDRHFCVNRETSVNSGDGYTRIVGTKYRYGSSVSGDGDLEKVERMGDRGRYICLMPTNAVPGDKCRLSLDMSDSGRWSDDAFGRRYAFAVNSLCGTNEHDLVRLILRRKRGDEAFGGSVGHLDKGDENWRPQREGESVIYADLSTGRADVGSFVAWTQRYGESPVPCVSDVITNGLSGMEQQVQNTFGIQLVGRQLSLFKSFSGETGLFRQYNFSGTAQIPDSVYLDFTNDMKTAALGTMALSTNLVMELEIVASSSRNPARGNQFSGLSAENAQNQLGRFEVFPAYEFAINIENKSERSQADVPSEPRLATVVHLEMDKGRDAQCTAITYDTHGTEISGWRTGERKAWRIIR